MKSSFELELAIRWTQERLFAEADQERLARQVRREPSRLRIWVAMTLYSLAAWLSPDDTRARTQQAVSTDDLMLVPATRRQRPQAMPR